MLQKDWYLSVWKESLDWSIFIFHIKSYSYAFYIDYIKLLTENS